MPSEADFYEAAMTGDPRALARLFCRRFKTAGDLERATAIGAGIIRPVTVTKPGFCVSIGVHIWVDGAKRYVPAGSVGAAIQIAPGTATLWGIWPARDVWTEATTGLVQMDLFGGGL